MIEITKYKIYFGYFSLWYISNESIGYITMNIYINEIQWYFNNNSKSKVISDWQLYIYILFKILFLHI